MKYVLYRETTHIDFTDEENNYNKIEEIKWELYDQIEAVWKNFHDIPFRLTKYEDKVRILKFYDEFDTCYACLDVIMRPDLAKVKRGLVLATPNYAEYKDKESYTLQYYIEARD